MVTVIKQFRKALNTAGDFQLEVEEAEAAVIQH
jgi:hypothetical protein